MACCHFVGSDKIVIFVEISTIYIEKCATANFTSAILKLI